MIKKLLYILTVVCISADISSAANLQYEKFNREYVYPTYSHNESSYQQAWCSAHKGVQEFKNKDYTRVDCLTNTHAVEFDFADKWAESIGQALHYQLMTGKKAMVVLILENSKKQMKYFNRTKTLGEKYNFDVEYVTPAILQLDSNGKCRNQNCKCHKINKKRAF